jgi:hypothetical protein
MTSTKPSCRYCGAEMIPAQRRCRECESWQTWRSYLLYPDTLWSQLGLLLTIAAAVVAWMHAHEARAERLAAESLRRDVGTVAEHMTRLAIVVADGSAKPGGLPAAHQEQIDRERQALLPHLSSRFASDVQELLGSLRKLESPGGR